MLKQACKDMGLAYARNASITCLVLDDLRRVQVTMKSANQNASIIGEACPRLMTTRPVMITKINI